MYIRNNWSLTPFIKVFKMVRQIWLIVLSISFIFSGVVKAESSQEIGEPYFEIASDEGKVDSMVLAPKGEYAYTLKNNVLHHYQLTPLKIIKSIHVQFETKQLESNEYTMFITNDEKHIVLYSKSRLRLLEVESGEIIHNIPFESELGVLNDDEFFTLDNTGKGVIWNISNLKIKGVLDPTKNKLWGDISKGNLIKVNKSLVLYRSSGFVRGSIIIYNSKTYEQIWRVKYQDSFNSGLSFDLNKIYIADVFKDSWYLGSEFKHHDKDKTNKGSIPDIMVWDFSENKLNYIFKKDFVPNLYFPMGSFKRVSPTHQYYIFGYKGAYHFRYPEKKIKRLKYYHQYNNGNAVLFSFKTHYFQATEDMRKKLRMKNKNGEVVLMNDATFNKYNKIDIDHKEW